MSALYHIRLFLTTFFSSQKAEKGLKTEKEKIIITNGGRHGGFAAQNAGQKSLRWCKINKYRAFFGTAPTKIF
ncbi:MAG: hypothetical protein ACI4M1_02610 [Christensenellales bacterium]